MESFVYCTTCGTHNKVDARVVDFTGWHCGRCRAETLVRYQPPPPPAPAPPQPAQLGTTFVVGAAGAAVGATFGGLVGALVGGVLGAIVGATRR